MTIAELKALIADMNDTDEVTLQLGDVIYEVAKGEFVGGWPNFINLIAGEQAATVED